jgi:hypothetical protein
VSLSGTVGMGRVIYIWAHVLVVFAACFLGVRQLVGSGKINSLDLIAAIWLVSNTLFVLCVGNVWGFQCFHRFEVPALPAVFWLLRRMLPVRLVSWLAIAAGSGVLAGMTIISQLRITG